MPMTDQEFEEFRRQQNDLLQGVMNQRNAAMDEQVNLGAIVRAVGRERDQLKAENAALKEQITKLMTPPKVELRPTTDPALLNGASPAAIDAAVQPAA